MPNSESVVRPLPAPSRIVTLLPWLFLAACLAVSVHYTRVGWDNALVDFWAFRETQTAISTRSLLENGFRIDYATPVLGAPWSIPFEFPTYHFCVAALVKITGMGLDPAGRCVSLFFGYGSFILAGLLIARGSGSRAAGIFTAALALVSPVYLYGSRAFMIESTALFFTLAMLLNVQAFLTRPRWRTLGWLVVAATLSGLTKATTYAIGLTSVAGLILLHARTAWPLLRSRRAGGKLIAGFVVALAVSFGLTLLWTWHTDVLKGRNEFAEFITSAALHDWNFGTWAQRLDLKSWDRIVGWSGEFILGTPITWVVGFALIAAGRMPRGFTVMLVATFASGSLVFTNLFLQHQHYLYANGIYLIALFGLGLGTLWDAANTAVRLTVGLLVAPLVASLFIIGYLHNSLPGQIQTNPGLLELAAGIRTSTPKHSAVVIYGYDWESTLPYYADRYALMDRLNLPAGDPRIQRAIDRLDRPLSGVVFMAPYRDSWPFIVQQLASLGSGHKRIFAGRAGDVYSTLEDPSLPVAKWIQAGFDGPPAAYDSPSVSLTQFTGRSAMLVHAPGVLALAHEAPQRSLHIAFGLPDGAYTGNKKSDGVTFAVDFIEPDLRTTRIFERRLNPAAAESDRGMQSADIALPDRRGTLLLRTEPGAETAFDWSVWQDVQQR